MRRNHFTTARQWELALGSEAVAWMHSSGVASRMLDDVCSSTAATLDSAIRQGITCPDEIIGQFPQVLSKCNLLAFNEPAQALAYLALHLPDRYTRVFQVLETLLVQGMLPLGRIDNFAAVDIGAGPGPGIFAVRNFFAALSHFASQQHKSWPVSPLGVADVVERSQGMSWAMHHFAEHLVMIEQSQADAPHPCASELARSATPFGAGYHDFGSLDIRREHDRARRRLAYELQDELDINLPAAMQLTYQEPVGVPSAYAVALMMNFMTTPDAVPQFAEAIRRLMGGALVPGGVMVVLGAVGKHYQATYVALDHIAETAGMRVLEGFGEPMQAGSRPLELAKLKSLTRQVWSSLAAHANNSMDVQRELRQLGASAIFGESELYRLPKFRVRAYRLGPWPRGAGHT